MAEVWYFIREGRITVGQFLEEIFVESDQVGDTHVDLIAAEPSNTSPDNPDMPKKPSKPNPDFPKQ